MVFHEIAKFRGHRDCSSGDMIFLICHVTSRDFMGGSLLPLLTTLLSLVTAGIVVVEM